SWISEHYFTTDGRQSFQQRVLERRRAWDETPDSPRARVGAVTGTLASALARADEERSSGDGDAALTRPLVDALGYADSHVVTSTDGPVTWLSVSGTVNP